MKGWFILFVILYSTCAELLLQSVNREPKHRSKKDVSTFKAHAQKMTKCDQTTIPTMEKFDLKQFAGGWYELAKVVSGYINANDGVWKIMHSTANISTFLYSGRDSNNHCIRPISGNIVPMLETPGELQLHYRTFSSQIVETIRVLFTDYTTIAVIYSCLHFYDSGECHPAGIFGSIWTRQPHVNVHVYENALKILEQACVDQTTLTLRNRVGPCELEDIEITNEEVIAPDICYQPLKLGTCGGNLQRFYYEPKEEKCKSFMYSGCGGNENNFVLLKECEKRCQGDSGKTTICVGPRKCALHCSPCCYEDEHGCVECKCESIIVDEAFVCLGRPSQCPNKCEAKEKWSSCYYCLCNDEYHPDDEASFCLEIKHPGQCSSQLERYYYNALSGKCEEFEYTGCGGNRNNFQTIQECEEKCRAFIPKIEKAVPVDDDDDKAVLHESEKLVIFAAINFLFLKFLLKSNI